jgi:hypothetical protein
MCGWWRCWTVSPTLKVKFSPEILIQCQMRRVRRKLWHIKHWETCIWGSLMGQEISCSCRESPAGCLAGSRDFMTGPPTGAMGPGLDSRSGVRGEEWGFQSGCHCWEQVGLRGIKSQQTPVEWHLICLLKELSPGQAWPRCHCRGTLAIAGANLPLSVFCEPFGLTF